MKHNRQQGDFNSMSEHTSARPEQFSADPSWFLDLASDGLREDLSIRYRQSRNLPDPASRPVQVSRSRDRQLRDWIEAGPRPPDGFLRGRLESAQTQSRIEAVRPRAELHLAWTFAMAAVVAGLCGAAAGVVNANFSSLKSVAFALIADTPPVTRSSETDAQLQALPTTQTMTSKKPIATATLDVSDVTGETNSLIPLALHAEPAFQDQDLVLRISGLPADAYLTSGHRSSDVWTLATEDLRNLKLMMPEGSDSTIEVAVAAIEPKTGELAAPVKSMTIALSDVVVQPVSGPPPGSMYASTHNPTPIRGQLAAIPRPASMGIGLAALREAALQKAREADVLLAKGDIAGAREIYSKVWKTGTPEGAFGLGRSFDPVALAALKLSTSSADSTKAIQWYEHAARAGQSEAISAIVRLRLKPS